VQASFEVDDIPYEADKDGNFYLAGGAEVPKVIKYRLDILSAKKGESHRFEAEVKESEFIYICFPLRSKIYIVSFFSASSMGGVVKNKQGGIKYDVFDDSGNFRGSFYHGEPIRQIKNNMAYIVSEDAEGCPMIKQYEIHFEPSPHLIRGAGLLAKPGEGCLLAFLRSREGLPAWPR